MFGKIGDPENENPFKNKIAEELKSRAQEVLGVTSQGAGTFADDSLKNVIDSVDKAIREQQDLQIEHLKGMEYAKKATQVYKDKAWREVKGMSNTDRLTKGADALGGVATAVSKFLEADGDGLKIISGCLDITNAIAQFLPPPATVLTGTVSGLFNLFAGGPPDPTNQQVVDDVKNAINRGFAQQKNFLEKKFGEQMNLIRAEFQKLEAVITDEFNELAENQRKYINQDHLRRVKNDALAQLEAVEEKLIFIKRYSNVKVTDDVAHSIDRQIAALSTTQSSALCKTTFEDVCPGILDDDYAMSKGVARKYCATLLYSYLMIEQDRSIVLIQLIAVLQNTLLRKSNEGYLEVYHHRKNEIEAFVKKTILVEKMACSLFNPQSGNAVLTATQISEISTYIESLSSSFKGRINAFKKKADCPRKYLET